MTFSTERRIEFCNTDAAGIAHFSAFFPMMESAEHELLRSLGVSVLSRHQAGAQKKEAAPDPTWPRVAASCDFCAPAYFEDILTIDVDVARIGSTSVEYQFRFRRDDVLIASGKISSVCCVLSESGLKKVPIPESVRQRLTNHLLSEPSSGS